MSCMYPFNSCMCFSLFLWSVFWIHFQAFGQSLHLYILVLKLFCSILVVILYPLFLFLIVLHLFLGTNGNTYWFSLETFISEVCLYGFVEYLPFGIYKEVFSGRDQKAQVSTRGWSKSPEWLPSLLWWIPSIISRGEVMILVVSVIMSTLLFHGDQLPKVRQQWVHNPPTQGNEPHKGSMHFSVWVWNPLPWPTIGTEETQSFWS